MVPQTSGFAQNSMRSAPALLATNAESALKHAISRKAILESNSNLNADQKMPSQEDLNVWREQRLPGRNVKTFDGDDDEEELYCFSKGKERSITRMSGDSITGRMLLMLPKQ